MTVDDMATEVEERDRDLAMKLRRPEAPQATGRCLYCEARVPDGARWCDSDCRDDWARATGTR